MCGTAGMFIGCAALSFCPLQQLLGTDEPTPPAYRSPFTRWHERASVRTAPRRVLDPEDLKDHYFAPELVPLARHPRVLLLDGAAYERVLARHLTRYLEFTAVLETLVVNRVALGIAVGTVGLDLPDEMRLDAYKIYCDEAYHALFSVDLAQQVYRAAGLAPPASNHPVFLQRLQVLLDGLEPAQRNLADLLFVVVSETLISATLSDVPRDPSVVAVVREVVRDHAMDEGRHHAYFAGFLHHLWRSLDGSQRRFAARLVPSLIRCFLDPDVGSATLDLVEAGLCPDEARAVAGEVFAPEVISAQVRGMATQTIRCFHEVGALTEPGAVDALRGAGLVEGS